MITLSRVMKTRRSPKTFGSGCSPKPALPDRALITPEEAVRLADVFGVLASETRLRLLHALARENELTPTALAEVLDMKVQAVSNQLQMLAARGIVSAHRNGASVLYRVKDPCIAALLDRGWCLAEDAAQRALGNKSDR